MFLIYNIIIYLIFNILIYQIIGPKYKYPFRLAEILTLFFSILVSFLIHHEFIDRFFLCVISALFLFYILFHIFNMIQTSPRVKLISIIGSQRNINKKTLYKIYDYDNIINNRLERMKSTCQIIVNSQSKIILSNKSNISKFIYVILIFIKKFL
tara:strand:+ start:149 stop:610 length:462 start_codon:yes stop_codon:yes gene_type:complete